MQEKLPHIRNTHVVESKRPICAIRVCIRAFYVLFASVLIGSLPEVIILLCLAHMVIFTLNRVLCIRLGCFVIPVVNYTYMYNVFKALPAN